MTPNRNPWLCLILSMALIGAGCSSFQNVEVEDAQPTTGDSPQRPAALELAPGDDGDLSLECAGGSMNLIANSQTYPLTEGELIAIPVSKPTEVDLECKVANGTFSASSKCFDRGHLRALFLEGKAILGCYAGPVPAGL